MTANVHRNETTATTRARSDWARIEPEVCMVRDCTDQSGPLSWSTASASYGWPITWAVCAFHYWRLDGGKTCVKVNEREPSSNRWLLMDDDLEAETPQGQGKREAATV